MNKIAIVTDSNSGITQEQAHELGVFVVPMPVIIDDKTYYEGIDIDRKYFYEKLSKDCNVSTSQPLPGDITKLWNDLLKSYDEIIYIPMSSILSRGYETAAILSNNFDGRVQVVNNQRISVSQRQSVLDALEMTKVDISAIEVKDILEKDKYNSSIYITVDTLEYLKKGGRITPTVATIGTLLKIKPVLQIQGELLDSFAKARTMNSAKKIMIKALKDDAIKRFAYENEEDGIILKIAHTSEQKEAGILKRELQATFPDHTIDIHHLPLSIACHLGPGSLGVGCIKKLKAHSLSFEKNIAKAL